MTSLRILIAVFMTIASCSISSVWGQSKPVDAAKSAVPGLFPGIISSPALLPGQRRWQMFTKNPTASVGSVAWSPDGRWLVMATGRIARIYDANGTPLFERILVGHTESIRAVRYSPDGRFLATASLDGTARIWTEDGQQVLAYSEHGDAVQDVSWHPEGQRLATAGVDGTVRIWSIDGKTQHILPQHQAAVNAVAWSPDGKRLASGCENKTIRLWSADGTEGPVLSGHLGAIESLAWNPDSQRLLSCDHGVEAADQNQNDLAHLKLWDVDGHQIASADLVDSPPSHVCWNSDGTTAFAGGAYRVRVWSFDGNRAAGLQTRAGPASVGVPVAWRPTGGFLAAGPLRLDVTNFQPQPMPLRRFQIQSVDVAAGNDRIAIGCSDQTFYLFDREGKNLKHSAPLMQNGLGVYACRFSPDGKTLAVATRRSQELQRFDIDGKPKGPPIKIPGFAPRGFNWSPDGKYLVMGGDQMSVGLVDVEQGTVKSLGQQLHGITQVQFTPDQQQVCSAGFDGCVRFWTLDGAKGPVLEALAAPIRGMDWADDGKKLATGHEDYSIRLWNEDGSPAALIGGHGGFVESVDFHPDGTKLASGSWDHTVRIWKRDGTAVSVLRGHEGALGMVRWSPDGQRLFSVAADGMVRCWDPESGNAEWTILFGDTDKNVTLDSSGRLKHGDESVLDSDFVFFAEDEQGRLVRTKWADIRAAIPTKSP